MNVPAEIAWAAGLFEGEGCALVRPQGTPHAALGMTDEEPVRRFHEVMGFGAVYTQARTTPNPRAATLWRWESCSKVELPRLAVLLPWLAPRRKAAVEKLIAACVLADRTEVNRKIVAGLTKTHYCECGRGPFYPGPLGKHRKACRT